MRAREGHSTLAGIPYWANLLGMAQGNLHDAIWLEENLTEEWAARWSAWVEVENKLNAKKRK